MKRIVIFVLATFSLIFVLPLLGAGQTTIPNVNSAAAQYAQVVDRAFQFSQDVPAEFAGIQYRVVVRFLPSFGPESQFVFLIKNNHTVRITEYRLARGSSSISAAYDQLGQNPHATVDDILRQVRIEKVERAVRSSDDKLIADLFALSIPAKVSSDVTLDGTSYELWIQTSSNEIHISFSEGAYGARTSSVPICRWAKAVQTQFLNESKDTRLKP